MITKRVVGVFPIVGLILLCVGLLNAAEKETGSIIKVGGSNSLIQSAENWGKAYSQENPGAVIVARGTGTEVGFGKLVDKEIDILFTWDPVSEAGRKQAAAKGLELAEHFIAWGGVCVVTHPDNPVQSLEVDQVRRMHTGEITSWKEVGGPDMAVTPFVRRDESPTRKSVFQTRFLRDKPIASQAVVVPSFRRLLTLMEEEKGGIALVGCLALTSIKNPLKSLALKKDPNSPAVKWNAETFKDKSYPLARPLFFYWDANSPAAVQFRKFADYCANLIWDGKCHVISDELCRIPSDQQGPLRLAFR
ncbi:MAG: substrate-binding domain-containing protein [Thermodesulfobacteriota bacterium]